MKLIGMLLIVLTCTGWGLAACHRLQCRAASLDLLARFADRLAERIRGTAAPLGSLLRELANVAEFERLPLLHRLPKDGDVRGLFTATVAQCADEMGLSAEDRRLVTEFADGWGAADLDGEVRRCRQYAAVFRDRGADARTDAQRKGRVYVTLGICGGSMLALLVGG